MKHIKLFEEFSKNLNEAELKPGRDENIASAIIAYFYAVDGTPEAEDVRALGEKPIRSDMNPSSMQSINLGGWAKDGVKKLSGASRVPSDVMLGNAITLVANNGKKYYFDDVEFVEGDKTIINNTGKMGFREFVDTLVKLGVIEKPKY
jgi:hypothetical protein